MSRVTPLTLLERKAAGQRIAFVTAYDYPSAQLADAAPIDAILVGDSVGMAVAGHDNTLSVTMDQMVYHASMVTRAAQRALVVVDMPFLSYHCSMAEAVRNAGRLVAEGGAQAVKLEGPPTRVGTAIDAILSAGIPVMGHIGLTPQSVHQLGGYKVQGRTEEQRDGILAAAQQLEALGCFGMVLECIPMDLAADITALVDIPTIGIGAGPQCDGQVLVWHDMLGWGRTRFAKTYTDARSSMADALDRYAEDVKAGTFPTEEHGF